MEEIWKVVPGYEGLYEASTEGRIRAMRWWPHKIMKFHPVKKRGVGKIGGFQIDLHLRGVRRTMMVPHVILETFVGPRPPGEEALHGDGDVWNNKPSNLRWGTHKENMADRDRHGTTVRGEANHKAKLTEQQVLEIRAYLRRSIKASSLAKRYGVKTESIYYIKYRRTWRHLA